MCTAWGLPAWFSDMLMCMIICARLWLQRAIAWKHMRDGFIHTILCQFLWGVWRSLCKCKRPAYIWNPFYTTWNYSTFRTEEFKPAFLPLYWQNCISLKLVVLFIVTLYLSKLYQRHFSWKSEWRFDAQSFWTERHVLATILTFPRYRCAWQYRAWSRKILVTN